LRKPGAPSQHPVFNLSDRSLNRDELTVLTKGLHFVPTPLPDSRPERYLGMHWPGYLRGCRRAYQNLLQGKHHIETYRNQGNFLSIQQAKLSDPDQCPPPVETAMASTQHKLLTLSSRKFRSNISRSQRKALRRLQLDKDLIIRQADKGSGITILDKTQYVREGRRHLEDQSTYERIDFDYTTALTARINVFLKELLQQKSISEETYTILRRNPDEVRIQHIYFLVKVHKQPREVRPIVSGIRGPTEFISAFVDLVLKPYVSSCPHVISCSLDVVNCLETSTFAGSCILATIDVKTMYLRIPQEEGVQRVLDRIYSHPKPPPLQRQALEELLSFILADNFFEFAGHVYRQTCGVAMGTRCAPSFANLFMAQLEDEFFDERERLELPMPSLWLRFLDDVLMIWEHQLSALQTFTAQLDSLHPSIKFETTVGDGSVNFLDLRVFTGNRFSAQGILDIAPYSKPIDTHQYLHYTSSHPPHTFRGIVRGETVRLLRHSSNIRIYANAIKRMISRFSSRGYPLRLLHRWISDFPYSARERLLLSTVNRSVHRRLVWEVPIKTLFHPGISRRAIKSCLTSTNLPFSPLLSELPSKSLKTSLVRKRTV